MKIPHQAAESNPVPLEAGHTMEARDRWHGRGHGMNVIGHKPNPAVAARKMLETEIRDVHGTPNRKPPNSFIPGNGKNRNKFPIHQTNPRDVQKKWKMARRDLDKKTGEGGVHAEKVALALCYSVGSVAAAEGLTAENHVHRTEDASLIAPAEVHSRPIGDLVILILKSLYLLPLLGSSSSALGWNFVGSQCRPRTHLSRRRRRSKEGTGSRKLCPDEL